MEQIYHLVFAHEVGMPGRAVRFHSASAPSKGASKGGSNSQPPRPHMLTGEIKK